jgi:hypothetical protein
LTIAPKIHRTPNTRATLDQMIRFTIHPRTDRTTARSMAGGSFSFLPMHLGAVGRIRDDHLEPVARKPIPVVVLLHRVGGAQQPGLRQSTCDNRVRGRVRQVQRPQAPSPRQPTDPHSAGSRCRRSRPST